MIVLTNDLASARIEARHYFPDSTWLPGDEPPVGETAVEQGSGRLYTILGVSTTAALPYWWTAVASDTPSGMTAFVWPPTLAKQVETSR